MGLFSGRSTDSDDVSTAGSGGGGSRRSSLRGSRRNSAVSMVARVMSRQNTQVGGVGGKRREASVVRLASAWRSVV